MLSDIETLMAIEQIRRLKARYFRFLDGKYWDEFGKLFVEDATMDARESFSGKHPKTGEWFVNGKAELVKGMDPNDMLMKGAAIIAAKGAELFPEVITMHHGHMSEIDIESENSARAIWAMEDRLLFLSAASPIREIQGFGHYHETYGRFNGEWKIVTSRLSRIRVDVS
jgi:SnoaL-like domain